METKSGVKFQEEYKEVGLRSHVAGSIDIDTEALIDRKLRRFMGDASAFSYIAMGEAIEILVSTQMSFQTFVLVLSLVRAARLEQPD